jgi:hypothetical protein
VKSRLLFLILAVSVQSGFGRFCPLEIILRKAGLKSAGA